jgi:hypothetical protein
MVSQHEYLTRDCNADKENGAQDTWTIEAKTVLISTVFRIRFVYGAGVTIN